MENQMDKNMEKYKRNQRYVWFCGGDCNVAAI